MLSTKLGSWTATIVLLAAMAMGCGDPEKRTVGLRSAPPDPRLTYHVGIPVEKFVLPDVDGTTHTIGEMRGRITVLEFWSCRCPLVAKCEKARRRLIEAYAPRGVVYFAIDSNRDEYPDNVREYLTNQPTSYCVLLDPAGDAARSFNAARTLNVFVLGPFGVVRYVGSPISRAQLERDEVERLDWLEEALDAILSGRSPDPATRPSLGDKIRRKRLP